MQDAKHGGISSNVQPTVLPGALKSSYLVAAPTSQLSHYFWSLHPSLDSTSSHSSDSNGVMDGAWGGPKTLGLCATPRFDKTYPLANLLWVRRPLNTQRRHGITLVLHVLETSSPSD